MTHAVGPAAASAAARRRGIITGQKHFASDYRPADLGWPDRCAHALLLRASVAGRIYETVDLSRVRLELQPDVLITATDLGPPFRNHISERPDLISGKPVELLVSPGMPIDYVGQPVAILLYSGFTRFRRAAQELREDVGPVIYGPPVDCPDRDTVEHELEKWRRLQADFAQGETHLLFDSGSDQSQWTRGKLTQRDGRFSRNGRPDADAQNLFDRLAAGGPGPTVETTTYTQMIDPAFMEPEAGLAWFDSTASMLHLHLGTQSPNGDVAELRAILGDGNPTDIVLTPTDIGGGFGGRDKSPFTFYLALAAMFSRTPVRMALDRREQFQGGLKRHASAVHSEVRASADGHLEAVHSFIVLRGGPETNLNTAVLSLAALHATGPYRVAGAGAHGVVLQRPIPTVGSMRGFGIPQVAFNIETAIDKLAVLEFDADPIAFRADKVLRHGVDSDIAGTPLRFHLATEQVCELARAHPLWQSRNDSRGSSGVRTGVGFACCIEAYGTSQDSMYCAVRVTPLGGVDVWAQTIDMGQGARQSLELVAAEEFGQPAAVDLGRTGWFEDFAAELKRRGRHGAVKISLSHGASSASKTAFFHVHVVREACRALVRLRLLPAARTVLGEPDVSDAELAAGWSSGELRLPGRRTVSLAELAAEMHRSGAEPGVMVHGYFCNGWSSASFTVDGLTLDIPLDALAFFR